MFSVHGERHAVGIKMLGVVRAMNSPRKMVYSQLQLRLKWRALHRAAVSPADSDMKCQEQGYPAPRGAGLLTGHIPVVHRGRQLACSRKMTLQLAEVMQEIHPHQKYNVRHKSVAVHLHQKRRLEI
jgi:hypothetical protein